MKSSQNSKLLSSLIFFAILAATALVPLTFLPGDSQAYALPKLALLALIVAIALALATIGLYVLGDSQPPGSALTFLVISFVILAALSYWQSMDKVSGLYGHYGRFDGLLGFFVFGGLYFVAIQIKWGKAWIEKLLKTIIVVGVGVALISIAEYWGLGLNGSESQGRPVGTLGNPVFLSGYLTIICVCAFALAQHESSLREKSFILAAAAIMLTAIIMTSSRSAVMALVAGIALIVVYYRERFFSRWRSLIGLVGVVVLIIGLVQVMSSRTRRPTLSESLRPARIEEATATRFELARSSLKMMVQRPWLGAGPSNFPWANQQVQSREDAGSQGRAWRSDDAHNLWFQTGVSLGIPALIVFAVIISVFFLNAWRLSKKNDLYLPFVAGIISYLVVATFEPANVTSNLFFWLFLGIVAGRTAGDVEAIGFKRWIRAFWLPMIMVLTTVSAFLFLKTTVADIYYRQAFAGAQTNDPGTVDNFKQAVSLAPHVDKYYIEFGQYFVKRARLNGSASQLLMGIDYLKQGTYWGSRDPENWIKLALAYNYASIDRPGYQGEALAAAEESQKLAPNSAAAYRCLGEIYFGRGSFSEALKHLRAALKIDPNYAEAWLWVGLTNEKLDNIPEAIYAYKQAVDSPTTRVDALMKLESLDPRSD